MCDKIAYFAVPLQHSMLNLCAHCIKPLMREARYEKLLRVFGDTHFTFLVERYTQDSTDYLNQFEREALYDVAQTIAKWYTVMDLREMEDGYGLVLKWLGQCQGACPKESEEVLISA